MGKRGTEGLLYAKNLLVTAVLIKFCLGHMKCKAKQKQNK